MQNNKSLSISPKIIIFDLDGTLIDGIRYSYQRLWEHFSVDIEEDQQNFQDYMNKAITYDEWVQRDVNILKRVNADRTMMIEALKSLKPMPGGIETLVELRRWGKIIGLISGGIDLALEVVYPNYAKLFHTVFINRYLFDSSGTLLKGIATPYDFEGKAEGVRKIAAEYGLESKDCAYIGDHENDISAMREAGIGIAFNAESERLKEAADIVIKEKDLRRILPLVL